MASHPRRTASSPYATTSSHATHTPRYTGAHSNSSAFSKYAQPNEDWTQVSDLAERRRIQNRIAQRNYRQKLKRRLEELERSGSVSPSGSPERSPSHEVEQSSSKSGMAPRRRTLEQSGAPSGRGSYDVQHLGLFGQTYDQGDSRMLGYQFCAQPSPPPPPSPPLPDSTPYVSAEQSRLSLPPSQNQSAWSSSVSQSSYYPTVSHHSGAATSSYPSSYTYSPNLSATSTPASRPDSQYWSRGSHDDDWSSWSSNQSEPHAQSHLRSWQHHDGPSWQDHYHNATTSKFEQETLFHFGPLDRYPTPPHSADLVNANVNPFDEFLDIESK